MKVTPPDASSIARRFPRIVSLPEPCWIVGGAVRDICLGREPLDIDLACRDAIRVAERFAGRTGGRLVEIGAEGFILVRVVLPDGDWDFAEIEGVDIEVDLARRDFTINAMAVHSSDGRFLDPFGGTKDLESRTIRMVDETNLDDDPLRLLRAVRFAVDLGFEIDVATQRAIADRAAALESVAPERISGELDRILGEAGFARGLELLHRLLLDEALFGSPLEDATMWRAGRLEAPERVTLFAILFRHVRGDLATCSERLKWSRARRDAVLDLISLVDDLATRRPNLDDLAIRLHDAGEETVRRSIAMLRAEGEEGLATTVASLVERRWKDLFDLQPLLDGNEISRAASVEPGPLLGGLKRSLVEAQLRGLIKTREEALDFVVRLSREQR